LDENIEAQNRLEKGCESMVIMMSKNNPIKLFEKA
jgi:hypothetical protein